MEIKIEKSKFPDDEGSYIVFLHRYTIHGDCWKRIFKGSFKECQAFKKKCLSV